MVAGGLRSPVLMAWILVLGVSLAGCVEDGEIPEGEPDNEVQLFDQVDLPCDERERPVAYPWEQEVDDPSEIRCPGHYAVTDEGDGAQAEVPQWHEGDWWHYRGSLQDQTGAVQCAEYREDHEGTGDYLNLSVYKLRRTAMECDSDRESGRERFYTKDSLNWAMNSPEGLIRPENLFPLVDGKTWTYMDLPMGNIVEVRVTHDDEYEFGGDTLEVWQVERTGEDLHTGAKWRLVSWHSDEVRHKVREEFHKDGVQQYFWQLVDSVDGYGEAPGIL